MDFFNALSWANISFLLEGFSLTLEVAGFAIVLSFLFGTIIGIIGYCKIFFISKALSVIVEIIRSLPLLLIIFFSYFGLRGIGIVLEVKVAAILALTVFESAMISEIVRGGLNSVDKGQMEAARSFGLSFSKALWLIILPQGLRRMVPPLISQFISLLKDTSLGVVIALPELTHHAKIVYGQNFRFTIPVILFTALLYFTVNYSLSLIGRKMQLKKC